MTELLTLLMVVVTAWLAVETRRMAKAAEGTIQLESIPALALRHFDITLGTIGAKGSEKSGMREGVLIFV